MLEKTNEIMRIQDKELENVYGTCGSTDDKTTCQRCGLRFSKSDAYRERMVGSDIFCRLYKYQCPNCKYWHISS